MDGLIRSLKDFRSALKGASKHDVFTYLYGSQTVACPRCVKKDLSAIEKDFQADPAYAPDGIMDHRHIDHEVSCNYCGKVYNREGGK